MKEESATFASQLMRQNVAKEGYTTFYVDGTNGNDGNNGLTWLSPFKTIQHAIDTAESWCKIYIKAGTYAENVLIPSEKTSIYLIGEDKDTVIIIPTSGDAVKSNSPNCHFEKFTTIGNGATSAGLNIYTSSTVLDVQVGNQNSSGYGLLTASYSVINQVKTHQTAAYRPGYGIYLRGIDGGEIKNCDIKYAGIGIRSMEMECQYWKVHDNLIENSGSYGIHLFGIGTYHNKMYHNNIINSGTANAYETNTIISNEWVENFYDDHTVDINNDGLCDTPYTFTTGIDHSPVSKRNGWLRESLGVGGSGSLGSLAYYGKISTYTDATHFKVAGLVDFGNDFFKNWYVYVLRDAAGAGAAPQGEDAKRISDYISLDGTFAHLAFSANLAVDDEVLILHESIASAGAGGDYSGDIEIWDSFEYPSNASLQAKWKESGGADAPIRVAFGSFYQQYSMYVNIIAIAGEVHRSFFASKDIGVLHNISIAVNTFLAADSFQFTLYDTKGNYSYWTRTTAAGNTWEIFNIDPHSTPTGDGGTPVDLDDVIEIRLANLTAGNAYMFDLIKFESLVASKIGIGYDGLDDALETGSSVRGHLLDITDDYLKYLTTTAIGSHTAYSIADILKISATEKIKNFIAKTGGTEIPAGESIYDPTIRIHDRQLIGGTAYFVGKGGDDANDGKTWDTRRLTVTSGYGLCASGDTLIIGPGTFTEDINFNTDGVWVIGRGQGLDGTTIDGASTMTCGSNRFETIFFIDSAGTVVKVGNDVDAQYNEFWNCRIGGGGVAIPVHIDATAGGRYNIFDHCNIYEGSTASVLIDGGAAIGNIFRNCRIRPETGVASHGIHVNHASALRNTFIDCVIVGAGSTGTGIYFQLGTHNIALNCLVNGITTPYNIAANNYIVGCHEGSLIATNNTIQDDLKALLDTIGEIQDVVIYPVSEHAGTTEITDDGTSPAYYADTESGVATVEGTPNVHWLEDIDFEQKGTITIISMYLEFKWQHKTSGGTAYSKIQVSRDGGSNWVDLTDSIPETNAAYQIKVRAGVGNFISTIVAGANQLQFRLVSWEAGAATSSAKIRSNSYIRVTYRKS